MKSFTLLLALAAFPSAAIGQSPEVASVHPSGAAVPENLLRISVVFRAPPDPGVLRRLGLHEADGTAIDRPFLDQELWSPDGTALTILLHPGRVKGGLAAHEAAGPPIRRGAEVTLRLDGRTIKAWRVGLPRTDGPDPARWTMSSPRVGTRDALAVAFDAPIDARAAGYLAVVSPDGERIRGRAELAPGEGGWTLTPDRAWAVGRYRLLAHPRLEDPQGNPLKGRFEQPVGRAVSEAAQPAELAFTVSEGPAAGVSTVPPAEPGRARAAGAGR